MPLLSSILVCIRPCSNLSVWGVSFAEGLVSEKKVSRLSVGSSSSYCFAYRFIVASYACACLSAASSPILIWASILSLSRVLLVCSASCLDFSISEWACAAIDSYPGLAEAGVGFAPTGKPSPTDLPVCGRIVYRFFSVL